MYLVQSKKYSDEDNCTVTKLHENSKQRGKGRVG